MTKTNSLLNKYSNTSEDSSKKIKTVTKKNTKSNNRAGRPKERDTVQCTLYLTPDMQEIINSTVLPALKTDPRYAKINFTKYVEMLIEDDLKKNLKAYEKALKPIDRK